MKKQQLEQITRQGEELLRLFPNANHSDPVKLCKSVGRYETKLHAMSTDCCNGVITFDTWDKRCKLAINRLRRTLLGYAFDGSFPVFVNGDARGYALKINSEWMRDNAPDSRLEKDWGGYGILAPEIN